MLLTGLDKRWQHAPLRGMHNGHESVQVILTLVELLHIIDSGVTIYGSSSLQVDYFPHSGFGFKSTWPIAGH